MSNYNGNTHWAPETDRPIMAIRFRRLTDGGSFITDTTIGFVHRHSNHEILLSDSPRRMVNGRTIPTLSILDYGMSSK